LRVEELGLHELEDVEEEWDELVRLDQHGTIFDTCQWLVSFWKNNPPSRAKSKILVVTRNGRIRSGFALRA
jgi:hypothetical protein